MNALDLLQELRLIEECKYQRVALAAECILNKAIRHSRELLLPEEICQWHIQVRELGVREGRISMLEDVLKILLAEADG
jgi:hypothetical protein